MVERSLLSHRYDPCGDYASCDRAAPRVRLATTVALGCLASRQGEL